MKIFEILEEKINAFLIKLFELIAVLLRQISRKIIPQKMFDKIEQCNKLLALKKEKIKAKKLELSSKLNSKINDLKSQRDKVVNIKSTLVIHVSSFFEEIRHPKKDGKKLKDVLFKYLSYLMQGFDKIKAWIMDIRPTVVVAGLITFFVAGLTVIVVMKNTDRILVKSGVKRTPANIDVILKSRPEYYKAEKRHMLMINIFIPVYVSDTSKHQTLSVDVQIVTSIRFTKEFLTRNQTLVRDKLNMTLEPIVPEFPLTIEGRAILKDKLKLEIENLLKEQNVPGHIEEIVIVSIFTA